jgi:hypothetical protein
VKDCDVSLEPWSPQKRPTNSETVERWTRGSKTGPGGLFKIGGTVRPGWYDVTLTINCKGFREIEHVFKHDRFHHIAAVILVRGNDLESGVNVP